MGKQPVKSIRNIVKVETDKGRLRLALPSRLSQAVYGKRQKYISLGMPDTPENRKLAQAKASQIQTAITFERFDPTLEDYQLGSDKYLKYSSLVKTPAKYLDVRSLWSKYVEYKSANCKPKTLEEYKGIERLLSKVDISSSLSIRAELLTITTNHRAKKTLLHLSAAHKWGVQHGLVEGNPFDGMWRELPDYNYQSDPDPNPFTDEEKAAILIAFGSHEVKGGGISYSYYLPFVNFLFLTGCRPSEAIGLQLSVIAPDYSVIIFDGSVMLVGGKQIRVTGSKNNRKRVFPVNAELKILLTEQTQGKDASSLVFPSPEGKAINYNNFSRRAWNKIVDPIKPDTTPYCCRDTFISEQIAKGIPPAIVAKWVDNSVATIEKYYFKNASGIVPL